MSDMVGVIGAGYVGLTTAACLAHLGHIVRCVDNDTARVARLARGIVDIREPQLPDLVLNASRAGRLRFDTQLDTVAECGVVVLCLPTPAGPDGAPDLGAVTSVATAVAQTSVHPVVLGLKSTVPPGSARSLQTSLADHSIDVVSNPEFLREGRSVEDFLGPDRIVVGGENGTAVDTIADLYRELQAPIFRTDWASAELAKYACNGFLALKASYTNELADLCEAAGADVTDVTAVMAADARIGGAFLSPGPGWGGSCLPKDTRGLLDTAGRVGTRLDTVEAAVESNIHHRRRLVDRIAEALTGDRNGSLRGHRVGVLGLTFKAGTDDLRDSPAVAVVEDLCARGATVTAYDPACGTRRALGALGSLAVDSAPGFHVVDDPIQAAKSASAIVVLTEWPEFRSVDWKAAVHEVDRALVVDARNVLDPATLVASGFSYRGIGRP